MPADPVLTGVERTMLATLRARALDAASERPVLGDAAAVGLAARLGDAATDLGVGPADAVGVALRARLLDRWTAAFLAVHPGAVVLHLGCGLDTRAQRVGAGPGVRWFDVDTPAVVRLREQLLPARPGSRSVAASVTDPAWLAEVPRDAPALVVAEGLTMYLAADEGPALLRRLVGHLAGGEVAFDTWSRLGVRLQRLVPLLRRTGARLRWGVDDPRSLERQVPGLRLLEAVGALGALEPGDVAHLPRAVRWQLAAVTRVPVLRDVGHVARYGFGCGSVRVAATP